MPAVIAFSRPVSRGLKLSPSVIIDVIARRLRIEPRVGFPTPASNLSSVDFPEPFAPMRPTVSP
jgi:hypothetical protein